MQWFLKRVVLVWLSCILIVSLAFTIGRLQPFPPDLALLRLTDCVAPCWIGIIPGQTSLAEARERIQAVYGNMATNGSGVIIDYPTFPTGASEHIEATAWLTSSGKTTRINVIGNAQRVVTSVVFIFSAEQISSEALYAVVGQPLYRHVEKGSNFNLLYDSASAKMLVVNKTGCEDRALSLEFHPRGVKSIPISDSFVWKGWLDLKRAICGK